MNTLMKGGKLFLCLTLLLASLHSPGQQLLDDFNRTNSATVGNPSGLGAPAWTEVETGTTTSTGCNINSNYLRLSSSSTSGREYVWRDCAAHYPTVLSTNTYQLTWQFKMRITNSDAQGFNAGTGNYGLAVVLGASTTNFLSTASGYAVVTGNSGSTDPIRLVRFVNGLSADANLTNLISYGDLEDEYAAVVVRYTPATNLWEMWTDDDDGGFGDVSYAGASLRGSATDATYTGLDLRYVGAFYNHGTSTSENGRVDEIYIPIIPTLYYSKSTGFLNDVSTWGTQLDGSGPNPPNFTTPMSFYNIRNNFTPSINAAWTVSGTGSNVVLGDSASAIEFIIPASFAYNGPIDLSANSKLTIQHTTIPAIGTIAFPSAVEYASSSAQTIRAEDYWDLICTGNGNRTWPSGTTRIANLFSVANNSFTSGSGTVDFMGTGTQFIPAINYPNMTNTGGGDRILASSGEININGELLPSIGLYTVTGSTINFSDDDDHVIPVLYTASGPNYNNLTISGDGDYDQDGMMVIGGNLTITDGNYRQNTGNTIYPLTIEGNLNIHGGDYYFATGSGANVLYLKGNLNQQFINGYNGRTRISGSSAVGRITFSGNTLQTISANDATRFESCIFTVATGANVKLAQNLTLHRNTSTTLRGSMNVNNGGILDCSTFSISAGIGSSGSAAFNLNSGGTLVTANANGVSGATSSITLSNMVSVYNNNANYQFNGSVPQITNLSNSTMSNLSIANAANVTLNSNITANGFLLFTTGKFITTPSFKISIGSSGNVFGANSSSYVNGTLERFVALGATQTSFAIGDNSSYMPVSLTFPGATNGSGSITGYINAGDHPSLTGSGIVPSKSVNKYWSLINNNTQGVLPMAGSFSFVTPGDIDAGADPLLFSVRNYASPSWYPTGLRTATANQTSGDAIPFFGDFAIGETTGNPTITCPSDITVSATTGCSTAVSFSATTSGNPSPTISYSPASGSQFPVGITEVTATSTNINGSTTCTFNVIVLDQIAPELHDCPANIVDVTLPGSCDALVLWDPPTAFDNCSVVITTNHELGELFPVGVTTVVYIAADSSGNTDTCTFTITINDNEAPTISGCPGDTTVFTNGDCGRVVTWDEPIANDNCSFTVSSTRNSGDFFSVGTTTVTYTVTDSSGNQATCSFTVTVVDNEAPVVTCPADTIINTDAGLCTAAFNYTVGFSDNCPVSVVAIPAPGFQFPLGTTTVNVTATDSSGNTSNCSFDVTVIDAEDPQLSGCPGDTVVYVAGGNCEANVSWTLPVASDNCSANITSSHNPGDLFSSGVTTVTYTATDPSGNDVSCSFDVTVSAEPTSYSITVCDSYTFPWGGNTTVSGVFAHSYDLPNGCDSLVTANVTVSYNTSSTYSDVACDTLILPWGDTAFVSGTYTKTYLNAAGCDSVITANVTINNSFSNSFTAVGCDSLTLPWGGTIYVSGVHQYTYTSAGGCDSVVTAFVTIDYTTGSSYSVTSCDSLTLPWNQTVYTSGIYSHTYQTELGCDSLVEATVTINYGTTSSFTDFACDTLVLPWGDTATVTGDYEHVYTAANGCDSVVKAIVTIYPSYSITFSETACDSLILPWKDTVTVSGTYTHVYQTVDNCDSIVTAIITINYSDSSSFSVIACDNYSPPWGGVITTSGVYSFTYATATGCDSVVTVNATINYSSSATADITICAGQSYTPPGGAPQNTSGTYVTVIGNAAGCDSTITTTLTVLDQIVVTAVPGTISCNGGSTNVNVSATGGTGVYVSGTGLFTGYTAGTYTFTVVDDLGCTGSVTISISEPPALSITQCSSTDALCFGGGGSVSAGSISNAIGNVVYAWRNSNNVIVGSTPVVNGLMAGTYTLTVNDACTSLTCIVVINEPPALAMSPCSSVSATCNGGTGSVLAGTVTNAVGTVYYTWTNSSNAVVGTMPDINGLPAGVYTLTVQDSCSTLTCTVTIQQPDPLSMGQCSKIDASCFGGTGTVMAGTVSNAVGTVIYEWRDSGNNIVGSSANVSGLVSGTYTLTVSDDCFTLTCTVVINEPAALTMTACTKEDPLCNGGSGNLFAGTVSNNVGSIIYVWRNSLNQMIGNGPTVTGVPAGTYTLTVSDNCSSVYCTVVIINPPALSMTACSHVDASCNGGTGSVASGTVSNSVGTVYYSWKNSSNVEVGTGPVVTGLPAGTYTLTVTDSCSTLICSQTISEPPAMTMTACTKTDATCFGGQGSVMAGIVSNSIGTVNYLWTDNLNQVVGNTPNVPGLLAGTYTLTVTDDCSSLICTVTIQQPDPLSMSPCSTVDAGCFGGTGTVMAGTVTNSVGTVNYEWRDSGNNIVGNTPNVGGLAAGTYTLTVSDDCSTLTCTVTINAPSALTMTACTKEDPLCNGGSGNLFAGTVSNNVGSIIYVWRNSQNQMIGNGPTVTGVPAGTYTLTVSDNCSSVYCTVVIINPPALSMTACSHVDASCNGGTGSVTSGTVSNSVGTVYYSWKNSSNVEVGTGPVVTGLPAGTYTLTVTDSCSTLICSQTISEPPAMTMSPCSKDNATCNGSSNGAVLAGNIFNAIGTVTYTWTNSNNDTVGTSPIVTGLPAGTYTLVVTDSCGSVTCTQTIGEPPALSLGACSKTDALCFGGTGTAIAGTVSNSIGTIIYEWRNSLNQVVGNTATTGPLPAGTYTLTVSDNCSSVTCTVTINEPPALTMGPCTSENASCHGGSGSANAGAVSNAVGNVVYAWRNSSNQIIGNGQSITGLPAGTYTLTVSDNCSSVYCTVTINQPLAMTMAACTHTDATCNGTNTGSVSAGAISNSIGTVTYNWTNSNNVSVGNGATVSNLLAGTYTLTVTDSCGFLTCTQTVGEPQALAMTSCSSVNATCFGSSTGSVSAGTISNAVGVVNYSWYNSNNQLVGSGATASNLPAGTYTLSVSDDCFTLSCTQTISEPGPLSMTACTHVDAGCFGGTGSVSAGTVSNAVGAIIYTWVNSNNVPVGNQATANNLPAGTYTLSVSDNCSTIVCTQTISEPPALSMTACSHQDAVCNGSSTGSVFAGTVSNAIGQVNYTWRNNSNAIVGNSPDVNGLPAGTYTLTVSDDCGMVICSQTIGEPGILSMGQCTQVNATCFGGLGSVSAGTLSNSVGTVYYSWRTSSNIEVGTASFVSGLPAGIYTLTVTDSCRSVTCTVVISEPQPLSMTACSHTDASCNGGTGTVSAGIVSNSVGPVDYEWRDSGNNIVGTTAFVSGLPAGTYTLTVNDQCSTLTCSQTISEPSALSMGNCNSLNATCNGGTGIALAGTVSNAVGPVNYIWRDGNNNVVSTSVLALGIPAGTYTLTASDNCSFVTCTVTITEPPALSMTACSHTDVTCVGGNDGTLTAGTVLNIAGSASYTWRNSSNVIVGMGLTVNNLPAGTYTLTVTDACGFVTCTQTINEPQPLSMTACSKTDATCFGGTGSVQAGTVTNSVGIVSYSWYNSSNQLVSSNASAGNLPAGTYTLFVGDQCGTITCVQTINQPAAVSGTTVVSSSGCAVNNGTASVTPSGGMPGYTYVWSPGGQTTQMATGLSVGLYTVTITDANGCTGTATASVTIPGGAPASPAAILGPPGACRNQTGVVFSVAPVPGATSYAWTLPGGASGSSTSSSITVNFNNSFSTGNICVRAINACGQSAFTCRTVVRLTSAPSRPSAIGGPLNLCPLTSATYVATAVTNATGYIWATTGGLSVIAGAGTNSVEIQAPLGFVTGTISVRSTNCIGNSSWRTITVNGVPSIPIWKGTPPEKACGGNCYVFNIDDVQDANLWVYSAPPGCVISSPGGYTQPGNPITTNVSYATICFPSGFVSGNVTVVAYNSCGASETLVYPIRSMPVQPGPIGGPAAVCKSQTNVRYSVSSVPLASSYTWTVTGGAQIRSGQGTRAVRVRFNTSSASFVTLTVTANNSCGVSIPTSTVINVNQNCRVTDEEADALEIPVPDLLYNAFPNPTTGKATIAFTSESESRYILQVSDLMGKLVHTRSIQGMKGYNGFEIDLSDLPKGMYLAVLRSEEGEARTLRLLIE